MGFWNSVTGAASQVGGFFKGAGETVWETGKGLVDLGVGLGKTAYDLSPAGLAVTSYEKWTGNDAPDWLPSAERGSQRVEVAAETAATIARNPGLLVDAVVAPIKEDWNNGNYGEAIGRGFAEVVMTVAGTKGVDKLGKAGKVADAAGDVARVANHVDDVADVGRVANRADDAADAGRTAENAEDVAGAERTADNSGDLDATPERPAVEATPELPRLQAHENAGGHLIERHVGKSEEWLVNRVNNENVSGASSFRNLDDAQHFVDETLARNQPQIDAWLNGQGGNRLVVNASFDANTGISVSRGQTHAQDVSSVRLVLERSEALDVGYKIVTGYPQKP